MSEGSKNQTGCNKLKEIKKITTTYTIDKYDNTTVVAHHK